MHQAILMIVCLLSFVGLAGCQVPLAVDLAEDEDTRPVAARVAVGGFRIQSIVAANTAATIDHLKLTLLMADAGGAYQATGVTKSVAGANVGSAVSLGNLKIGKSYRVRVDAYADASEATLISVPAASQTTFTTPSVTTTAGVQSINDTAITMALAVTLTNKTYAGSATFSVALAPNIRNRTDQLRVTLYQVGTGGALTQRYQKTVAYAGANPSFTAVNLRHGVSYRLIAEAQGVSGSTVTKLSDDANSALDFAVPSPTGGQLDDDVNTLVGALSVPCAK